MVACVLSSAFPRVFCVLLQHLLLFGCSHPEELFLEAHASHTCLASYTNLKSLFSGVLSSVSPAFGFFALKSTLCFNDSWILDFPFFPFLAALQLSFTVDLKALCKTM